MYEDLGKTSSVLENRPLIFNSLLWVWEAFWRLCAARQVGQGPGPISFSDIRAYCELFKVKNPRHFVSCIQALDAVWLESVSK